MAATIGVIRSATNAVMRAANARPKTNATASSMRLPRMMNALNSWSIERISPPRGGWEDDANALAAVPRAPRARHADPVLDGRVVAREERVPARRVGLLECAPGEALEEPLRRSGIVRGLKRGPVGLRLGVPRDRAVERERQQPEHRDDQQRKRHGLGRGHAAAPARE